MSYRRYKLRFEGLESRVLTAGDVAPVDFVGQPFRVDLSVPAEFAAEAVSEKTSLQLDRPTLSFDSSTATNMGTVKTAIVSRAGSTSQSLQQYDAYFQAIDEGEHDLSDRLTDLLQ